MIPDTTSQLNLIPKRTVVVSNSKQNVETLQTERQQSADERQGLPLKNQENQPLSSQELDAVVVSLNDYIESTQREIHFSVDEESGRTVVKVIDSTSDNVIRQIPSEEILAVARQFHQDDRGLLANEMA